MTKRARRRRRRISALLLLVSAALLFTSPLWADEQRAEPATISGASTTHTSPDTSTAAGTSGAATTSGATHTPGATDTPGATGATAPPPAGSHDHRSVLGRPLEVTVTGDGERTVLMLAGIHGDEAQGVDIARALAEEARQRPDLLHARVVIMPAVNPDGLAAGTRGNARGVDLNRNYPTDNFAPGQPGDRFYGGPQPASEPETRAVLAVIEEYRPDLIVALHAPLACVNYDGPAQDQAAAFARAAGLPLEPDLGYATPGSLGTYYGREAGIPVITVELGDSVNEWSQLRGALLELL